MDRRGRVVPGEAAHHRPGGLCLRRGRDGRAAGQERWAVPRDAAGHRAGGVALRRRRGGRPAATAHSRSASVHPVRGITVAILSCEEEVSRLPVRAGRQGRQPARAAGVVPRMGWTRADGSCRDSPPTIAPAGRPCAAGEADGRPAPGSRVPTSVISIGGTAPVAARGAARSLAGWAAGHHLDSQPFTPSQSSPSSSGSSPTISIPTSMPSWSKSKTT